MHQTGEHRLKKIERSSSTLQQNDFVFTTDSEGNFRFNGDFEGLYQSDSDPWAQSATGESADYYIQSRNRVANILLGHQPKNVLEIGCGLGFALEHFNRVYPCHYTGWDISHNAIFKAKKNLPRLSFDTKDITESNLKHDKTFDVVILNQLLWYILPQLDAVLHNCLNLLSQNGKLIVSNAFARDQRFGKEYIEGFGGAFNYFHSLPLPFDLIHAEFNDDNFRNLDGLFVFQKQYETQQANDEGEKC
jgi:SAM-dependent methyltransferase